MSWVAPSHPPNGETSTLSYEVDSKQCLLLTSFTASDCVILIRLLCPVPMSLPFTSLPRSLPWAYESSLCFTAYESCTYASFLCIWVTKCHIKNIYPGNSLWDIYLENLCRRCRGIWSRLLSRQCCLAQLRNSSPSLLLLPSLKLPSLLQIPIVLRQTLPYRKTKVVWWQ